MRWLASSIHAAGDAELLLVMRVSAPHEMQQQLSHESPARQVCTCSHTEKLASTKTALRCARCKQRKAFFVLPVFLYASPRANLCSPNPAQITMPWARRARTMQWKAFCACRLPATCGSTATRAMPSSSFTMSPPSTRDVTHEGARDRTRSHGARREARLADDHAHEMNINSLILSGVGRRMNK